MYEPNGYTKESNMIKRHKQPYLVNPFNPINPYEILSIPSREVVAEIDKKGRFKKVKTIKSGKSKKAKKISAKLGRKLLKSKKIKKIAPAKSVLKRTHKKVNKAKLQAQWDIYKDLLKHSGLKMTKKDKIYKKRYKLNPIALIGNPKRSVTMKKRSIKALKRRNPFSFIKQREGKELMELAIDGAVIVVSSTTSKLLMDKIAEKISVLNKPIGKVAGHLGLGALIYLGGSKIKKIPSRYVRLATLGAMLPAIIDMVDFVKAKVSGVKELGQDDEEMLAYVPETSAYVPETSDYVPETSELGEDYTTGY